MSKTLENFQAAANAVKTAYPNLDPENAAKMAIGLTFEIANEQEADLEGEVEPHIILILGDGFVSWVGEFGSLVDAEQARDEWVANNPAAGRAVIVRTVDDGNGTFA